MAPATQYISPARLAVRLTIYFAALLALIIATLKLDPEMIRYLPLGGLDAIDQTSGNLVTDLIEGITERVKDNDVTPMSSLDMVQRVSQISLFVAVHLIGTLLVMLPITWTYMAINYEAGFNRNFARALMVLPLVATTTVLLIQDSLALAFGLAALVAAVRFRVALQEAMDGIFIFAAICVGLSSGIGYLGVAIFMGIFFCYVNLLLWLFNYGQNPVDDARRQRKQTKLEQSADEPS